MKLKISNLISQLYQHLTFKADPEVDGTKSETFVIISFKHKVILIGGTEYAGEMKRYFLSNELSFTNARYHEHALFS